MKIHVASTSAEEKAIYNAPLAMIDTSAIISIFKAQIFATTGENAPMFPSPKSSDRSFVKRLNQANKADPIDIIDQLSTAGHTLILTREVLTESLRAKKGFNNIAKKTKVKGNFIKEIVTDPSQLTHEYSREWARYLDQRQQAGEVRCYESVESFELMDEINSPKGGIVIVDMGHIGHYNHQGNNRIKAHCDFGDKSLLQLAEKISHAANKPINFPVISCDHGIADALIESKKNKIAYPFHTDIRACVRGLSLEIAGELKNFERQATLKKSDMGIADRNKQMTDWWHAAQTHSGRLDPSKAWVR